MSFLRRASDRPRTYYSVAVLVIVAVLFGGASRYEVLGPLAVMIAGLAVASYLVWVTPRDRLVLDRPSAWLLAGIVALPLVQLVPLPYVMWSALPGRDYAVEVMAAIGAEPWSPISLAPQRTWAALFALIAPCVAFIATCQLEARGRRNIALIVVTLASVSALLAVIQMSAGAGSAFRFYAITTQDSGVGFFANPNHQGTFLAIGVVLMLGWLGEQFPRRGPFPTAQVMASVAVVALLAGGILLTGSRAGILFLAVAVLAGATMMPFERITIAENRRRLAIAILVAGVVVVSGGLVLLATNPTVQQLLATDLQDGRVANLATFWPIIVDMFPFGSGLGTFDPVYRTYETLDTLTINYLNQAHNEPAQLLIEGGIGAAALIVAGLAWWVARVRGAWAGGWTLPEGLRLRRAASVATGIVIVHSLVDYPLRTAAIAVVFAVVCAMMLAAPQTERARVRRL